MYNGYTLGNLYKSAARNKIGSLFTMKLDKTFYLYIFTEIVLIQGLRFPNKRFMVTKFDYLL